MEPSQADAVPQRMRIAGRIVRMTGAAAVSAGLLLAGCGAPGEAPGRDPFTATGELIAFSGGEAGARNACFTCHGLEGQGDGEGVPRLAGLPYGYLAKQLQDYADGRRPDPTMHSIASKLSQEQRLSVAAWYAAMPAPEFADAQGRRPAAIAALYQNGDPGRGLAACARCHGPNGEGRGPASPPLAGQPAPYLAEQLRLWREAKRRNSPQQVMLTISQTLTESEITALADYAAGLPGGERAVPR